MMFTVKAAVRGEYKTTNLCAHRVQVARMGGIVRRKP